MRIQWVILGRTRMLLVRTRAHHSVLYLRIRMFLSTASCPTFQLSHIGLALSREADTRHLVITMDPRLARCAPQTYLTSRVGGHGYFWPEHTHRVALGAASRIPLSRDLRRSSVALRHTGL